MSVEVVGGQWLLDPGEIEFREAPSPPDRLVEGEALVCVGHDLVVWPQRRANGREPPVVFRNVRPDNLNFRAGKALLARRERILDQRAFVDVKPAALGGVERPAVGRAAGD